MEGRIQAVRQKKHGGTASFDYAAVEVVLAIHRDKVGSFAVRTPEN